jgi:arabinose-5-phosphate isomerase
MNIINKNVVSWGKMAILAETQGLQMLAESLGSAFGNAVNCLLYCKGRIIVAGMGKSGHIGKKIASTLASTGSIALFVHPAEASHGDLGMIDKQDVVIVISKSGESPELRDMILYCQRLAIPIIAITVNAESSLGKAACHLLLLPKIPEACPLDLAPTTSTTMTLALGDALAIACLRERDFQPEQFHEFHPGGKLSYMHKKAFE